MYGVLHSVCQKQQCKENIQPNKFKHIHKQHKQTNKLKHATKTQRNKEAKKQTETNHGTPNVSISQPLAQMSCCFVTVVCCLLVSFFVCLFLVGFIVCVYFVLLL
jgi:hypothetical protein